MHSPFNPAQSESDKNTFQRVKSSRGVTVHTGEILETEFMEPMKTTAYRLAKGLDFPGIYGMLRCKRAISAETALRPEKYFGLPAHSSSQPHPVVSHGLGGGSPCPLS